MRGLFLAEELAQDNDAFFHTPHALARFDSHHRVLQGLRRALLVRPAETDGEPGAPVGDHIQARPLLGEKNGMAVYEGRHAAYRQAHFRRDRSQRGQQGYRLQPGLGQQAVANPDRIKDSRGFCLLSHAQQRLDLDRSDDNRAVRQGESEGLIHGRLFARVMVPRQRVSYKCWRLSPRDRT